MPNGSDWGLLVAFLALAGVVFNVWLLLRVLGFMRAVENTLLEIERHTSKTAEATKRLAD